MKVAVRAFPEMTGMWNSKLNGSEIKVISDVSDCFAEPDNAFQILEDFPQFLCHSPCNIYRQDRLLSLIYIINIFSIIFLSLDNQ